jgi:hypothetical protein
VALYIVIGVLLGAIALRQQRVSARHPLSTIAVWAALWPGIFVLARITDPPADVNEPYRLRYLATLFAAIVAVYALAIVVAQLLSVSLARPLFTLFGVGVTLGAWLRPRWLWRDPDMVSFRLTFGDWLARAIYLALGAVLIWLGLFTDVQFPPR